MYVHRRLDELHELVEAHQQSDRHLHVGEALGEHTRVLVHARQQAEREQRDGAADDASDVQATRQRTPVRPTAIQRSKEVGRIGRRHVSQLIASLEQLCVIDVQSCSSKIVSRTRRSQENEIERVDDDACEFEIALGLENRREPTQHALRRHSHAQLHTISNHARER